MGQDKILSYEQIFTSDVSSNFMLFDVSHTTKKKRGDEMSSNLY
jgi:hypothetical protein